MYNNIDDIKFVLSQCVVGWMDGWMDGWVGGWMDGWMGGWMGGWMDGWMDGWMWKKYLHALLSQIDIVMPLPLLRL